MTIPNFLFLALSALTLICAIMVVISKNPIHSVLYLILTMFSISGHYILLQAQFIAVVNIIVYAGAIMVLFLFVLMLLNLNTTNEPNKSMLSKMIGVSIGLFFLATLATIYLSQFLSTLTNKSMPMNNVSSDFGLVKPLGHLLFTEYVFPFEIASILFIAAIVGVVFLGQKEQKNIEK